MSTVDLLVIGGMLAILASMTTKEKEHFCTLLCVVLATYYVARAAGVISQ